MFLQTQFGELGCESGVGSVHVASGNARRPPGDPSGLVQFLDVAKCYIGTRGRCVGCEMPAPYPKSFCAGFTISANFTLSVDMVRAVVVVQTFEQTGRRDARAKFTFPWFWEIVTALIGTVILTCRCLSKFFGYGATLGRPRWYSGSRHGTPSQTI